MQPADSDLRLEDAVGWRLAGPAAGRYGLVNEYLGYLADRNYSPKTVRAYGFDLLAFCRWATTIELAAAMADYIDNFYNPERRHSYLGNISPTEFETLWTSTYSIPQLA